MLELTSNDYSFADFLYLKKILKTQERIKCSHNCFICECYKACLDIRRLEDNINKKLSEIK